jgi:hypothetical protein
MAPSQLENPPHADPALHYVHLRGETALERRPQTAMGFRTYYGGKSAVFRPFYLKQEAKAAIHLAAERESGVATLETLISHRVDVNIKTSNNHTTLQLALEAGKSTNQILSILLQARADPNAFLKSRQTIQGPRRGDQDLARFGRQPFDQGRPLSDSWSTCSAIWP